MSGLAVPPSWKDLGKSSNDLLGKDFPTAGTALEVKTKTPSNVTFKVAGTKDAVKNTILGDLEAKYSDSKNGVVFTQTWTTTNALKSQLELENNIANGLKIDVASTLFPQKTGQNITVNTIYKQPGLHTRAFIDLFKGPIVTADTVFGRNGFLLGAEASYNVQDGKITKYATALGYTAPEYAVTLHALGNLRDFSASYYHRVNADVEAGAKAFYKAGTPAGGVSLEVGTKVYLDKAAFVKAKIGTNGFLTLGYTQTLRPGVKAAFGLGLDTQKLNDPTATAASHRVGASFTFEN